MYFTPYFALSSHYKDKCFFLPSYKIRIWTHRNYIYRFIIRWLIIYFIQILSDLLPKNIKILKLSKNCWKNLIFRIFNKLSVDICREAHCLNFISMIHHPSLCIPGYIMWLRICSHLPLPLRNRYFTGVSTDKNLRTIHPFLHFVSSFLIPPPGVTSPQGGSSDQGLRRGCFARTAKRMPTKKSSKQIIALEIFLCDRRVKEMWKLKTDI